MHVPFDLKLNEGWNKLVHRKAMSLLKGFPKEIIWNTKKTPFSGAFKRWVYEDLFDFFLETLTNAQFVDKLVDISSYINKFKTKELSPDIAWRTVNVELWCRIYFDKQSTRARIKALKE
jgi:hypothetical protein